MIERIYQQTPLYHFESLQAQPSIKHYVSSRQGGVSTGDFDSLNISFNTADSIENAEQNRSRIANAMGIGYEQLIFARQTHGSEVLLVDKPFLSLDTTEKQQRLLGKDALISNQAEHCLCITAADCVPILLYDPVNKAIGAAHAGWRGTAQQIVAKTLSAMQANFGTKASDILVGIGPSIGGKVYEVGPEVLVAIEQAMGTLDGLIAQHDRQTGKALLDLWKTNQQQLLEMGVPLDHIDIAGICTYTQHERFFSARRFGGKGGRFSAGIMLVP